MKISYKVDSFCDYSGNNRKFVVAAVSDKVEAFTQDIEEDKAFMSTLPKAIFIGVSCCHPEDEFNEELGVNIAIGKALKYRNHAIYTTEIGIDQDYFMDALVTQEVEHFKKNPGYYIDRYNSDKLKYQRVQSRIKFEESLDEVEKDVYNYLKECSPQQIDEMLYHACGGDI